jgi:hypothetical protein
MIPMKKIVAVLSVTASMLAAGAAQAAPLPYSTPGIENKTTYTFNAAADGDLIAYFAGSTAGYTNEIGLFVNGVDTGIYGLNNQTTSYGDTLNFGAVNKGDSLVFVLKVLNPSTVGPWYSQKSLNTDGANHVFSSAYAGDGIVPAGTYVAFEDLTASGADFNYHDENFVFTNISATVPEPATLATLAMGLGLMGTLRRKARKQSGKQSGN